MLVEPRQQSFETAGQRADFVTAPRFGHVEPDSPVVGDRRIGGQSQVADPQTDPGGHADGDGYGERRGEQRQIEQMSERTVAQLQQLIAGLFEDHRAARPSVNRDGRACREQRCLTRARTQPFGRPAPRERLCHALAGQSIGRRRLQWPMRCVARHEAPVPTARGTQVLVLVDGQRAGNAQFQRIHVDDRGKRARADKGGEQLAKPGSSQEQPSAPHLVGAHETGAAHTRAVDGFQPHP